MSTLAVANISGLAIGSAVNFYVSPIVPTPTVGDSTNKVANTNFVMNAISAVSAGFSFVLGTTTVVANTTVGSLSSLSLDNAPLGTVVPAAGNFTTSYANLATGNTVASRTQVFSPLGSPSAPSFAFGNEVSGSNTGFYSPSSGTVTVSINGADNIRFVSGASPVITGTVANTDISSSLATTSYVSAFFRLIGIRTFTVSNSGSAYTPTTGTRFILVEAVGGGGAGGGSVATGSGTVSVGGGGSSGGYAKSFFSTSFSGVTLTIGNGGTPVTGGNGGAGTTTSFGTLIVCPGGGGGTASAALASPALGSALSVIPNITGANIRQTSSQGHAGLILGNGFAGGVGASSPLGQGGYAVNTTSAGNSAIGYGAGGGGAATGNSGSAQTGGSGAPGVIRVWEFA